MKETSYMHILTSHHKILQFLKQLKTLARENKKTLATSEDPPQVRIVTSKSSLDITTNLYHKSSTHCHGCLP